MKKITLLFLIKVVTVTFEFEKRCPVPGEWRFRAEKLNCSNSQYVCLLNVRYRLKNTYKESCDGLDYSSTGSKLIFEPFFNKAQCSYKRYQPFPFSTDGYSECVYQMSLCNGEGQFVFHEGSFRNDTTCGCIFPKAYTFVFKPKNKFYCIPSEEDCSCYKLTSENKDNHCCQDKADSKNNSSTTITDSPSDNSKHIKRQKKHTHRNTHAMQVTYFIFASMAIYVVIVLLKIHGPPTVVEQESNKTLFVGEDTTISCTIKSYLPLIHVTWQEEPGGIKHTKTRSPNTFEKKEIRTFVLDVHGKVESATYKCIAWNINGRVESKDILVQSETIEESAKQEILQKDESGKHYFARVILIGKNGVGKTSLLRRLLWQNKKTATNTESTDGIDIGKCNINVQDGTWAKCKEADNELTRLIHQVYREKKANHITETEQNLTKQKFDSYSNVETNEMKTGRNADEAERELEIEYHSTSSSTKTDTQEIIEPLTNEDSINQSSSEERLVANIENGEQNESTSLNKNQYSSFKESTSIQILPEIKSCKKCTEKADETDHLPDDDVNIDKMTSAIIESYFKQDEKHVSFDMLAFCCFWDFAGQKDFYATHQTFLSTNAIYLLVTDCLEFSESKKQWVDLEHSAEYVSFWFDAIHCYWAKSLIDRLDPPIIVVCTNEDKFNKDAAKRQSRRHAFEKNLGESMKGTIKKRHLRNVFFVSNTEDNDSVFETIRKEISEHAMYSKDWGRDCPLKWLLFQQILVKLRQNNLPVSSTAKLQKIAEHTEVGIKDMEFKECLKYYHDLGTIIYFDEDNLRNYVILDPKWLIDAFRCLVSDKIESTIKCSDAWINLRETGELADSLITLLLQKEPIFKFLENKSHLLEVMKRFDIIVNLKGSPALYMPCMMESCSLQEVENHFNDKKCPLNKTSWLCLEFEFLPPAFFNHVLAMYIRDFDVSIIHTDKIKRFALYRQIGVFNLKKNGCEQLVICESSNIIALQVWKSGRLSNTNDTYHKIVTDLIEFIENITDHYKIKIELTKTFKCKDGNIQIHRSKKEDLQDTTYRCFEHKCDHFSYDLLRPWARDCWTSDVDELDRMLLEVQNY